MKTDAEISASPGLPLLLTAARLRDETAKLRFSAPVTHTYNPLDYAWEAHAAYLTRYGAGRKRVVFVGMNPGPWGMVQTGVPFGEIGFVTKWLKITGSILPPSGEHPKRPIQGFACQRTEISGKRLWGLFADRFKAPAAFFADHFVANYCPLAFLEETGRNRTPDKLPAEELRLLYDACDRHLQSLVEILDPEWLIGVGAFAEERCKAVAPHRSLRIGRILHPSPASPAANRDWSGEATRQLLKLKVWQ